MLQLTWDPQSTWKCSKSGISQFTLLGAQSTEMGSHNPPPWENVEVGSHKPPPWGNVEVGSHNSPSWGPVNRGEIS